MATVHRERGFAIRVFPNDHLPAHVHVWKAGNEVVIILPTNDSGAEIREVRGAMKDAEIVDAVEMVQENAGKLWQKWRENHG